MLARWLLIVAFVLGIAAPAVEMKLHLFASPLDTEKRQRAPFPRLTGPDLEAFPRGFDAWFRDAFGFREELIRRHSIVKVKWLRQSPVRNVIIGDEGWLFYAGYGDGADISDFQGKAPLSDAQLDARRLAIEARAEALRARGIAYLFVVAPNKHSVYPELLPARIGERRPGNRLDQFVGYMRSRSSVPVVDLRDAMVVARRESREPLYYRTDTHWNGRGAFVGYEAVIRAAQTLIPGLAVVGLQDFIVTASPKLGGDLADMLSMHDDWSDVEYRLTLKEGAPSPAPLRVAVLGDSFAHGLTTYLQASFRDVVSLHVAQHGAFDADKNAAQKPALLTDERVERYLTDW